MIQRYLESVRRARSLGRDTPAPAVVPLVVGTSAALILYITASLLLIPPGEEAAFNFSDERGAITALSAIFLGAGAGFALASFILGHEYEKPYRLFWLALTCALGFLAMDELLQFHERFGRALEKVGPLGALVDHTPLRNLNDLFVILYGVVALPIALCFLPGVMRIPRVLELFAAAFVFYVIHTAIDSTSEPRTFLSVVFEESAKLYSSSFIALASIAGLIGVATSDRRATNAPPDGGPGPV